MHTPLSSFPLLIQGGSILPLRLRVRRSSPLMWQDPFTLIVAVGKDGSARGQLYLDDGVGYSYEQGDYVWRQFDFTPSKTGGVLKSSNKAEAQSQTDIAQYDPEGNAWAQAIAHVRVERILVIGLKTRPTSVTVGGEAVEWAFEAGVAAGAKKEGKASELVIKHPGVGVTHSWEVVVA